MLRKAKTYLILS